MRCALVFYSVVTVFGIVHSSPELCVIEGEMNGDKFALCGRDDVKYTLDFIPPISQNISHIDLQGQPLKQLPYNGFRNLSSQSSISVIVLRHCHISHLDIGALLNLHNLTNIDLSRNDINQIDSKLFSDTKQIKDINMEYNKIEVLPRGLFQNLTLLEVVNLNDNRIRQVERSSFKNTPSLWLIGLCNNQIESMNMLFENESKYFVILSLAGNPWKCNCELGSLYEFLIKLNQLDQSGLVCEKPATLHGRKWSDISRDEFVCPSEDAISTQNTIMSSTEPTTTTEQDDTIPVTVYHGTRYQPVNTGIPQPPSIQKWILYTGLVLVCIVPVIIGVVFVVRRTLAKSHRKYHVQLPTIIKRRSDRRTNSRKMDSDLPMRIVQSSVVSRNSDCASNMADVDKE